MKLGGRRGDGGWDEGGGHAERQEVAAWLTGRRGWGRSDVGNKCRYHVAGLGPGRMGVCSMGHDRETDFERDMGVSLKMS